MRVKNKAIACAAAIFLAAETAATAEEICKGFGPQAPRDIRSGEGMNPHLFALAPPPEQMNLCNIHFHTNAEHAGPGFSVSAGEGEHGGFRCNESAALTPEELDDGADGHAACHGVRPGDTVEVHWVFTTCDAGSEPGLGGCLNDRCANPQLRVEAQVFLVVNDAHATDFRVFASADRDAGGQLQPPALPSNTGVPVLYRGSTTGSSYNTEHCSPMQVTWSVRPACMKVNAETLHAWCNDNAFKEDHAHGVRPIVTTPELLSSTH